MIFKKPLAKLFNTFTDKPISDKTLTVIDIVITVVSTLATIVGIFVALQFGLVSSLIIALLILGIIPVTLGLFWLASKRITTGVPVNPYTPWTPVTPPQFVGRQSLLKQLANHLDKDESVSLVGDRRIGKTSVLQTWEQMLIAQERPVIYVTGEGAEAADLALFINKITQQQASNEPEQAANLLSQWANDIKKSTHYPPLVLVDEAERFIEKFPPRFFERLRGMLGRVVWIFASRQDIDEVYSEFHQNTSPFENRLSLKRLGLLEPKEAEALIQLGQLTAEEAALMRRWAGRHPFFLQLLGRCLLEGRGKSIQTSLDEFQNEADKRLRRIWGHLTQTEQQALKNCVSGELATLRSLRSRGLVTEEGYLFGQVLEEWLKALPEN
jgi:hypothetical protein